MLDVKGDLTNLGLSFPDFSPTAFEPWVQPTPGDRGSIAEIAAAMVTERQQGLAAAGIGETELLAFADGVAVRIITPGSDAGEPLHLLLASVVKQLESPWFVMRNDHDKLGTVLVQPRYVMSYMRGPLTPAEIRRLRGGEK